MQPESRAIDKIYRRRDRYEIPDWQREEVWNGPKKQLLIDSILRGWKLPKFYFLQISEDPAEYEVVDGQQRLSAIFEFFDGDLTLLSDSGARFGGSDYDSLPDNVRDRFDDFEIEFDIISDSQDEEVKEFFQRLQAGMPLTSSERLNSIQSNLRDYCRDAADHPFFRDKVHLKDTRYAHFDVTTKVAAIEIEGLSAGLRYDDLRPLFESQSNFSSESQVAKRIDSTLDYLNRVFPERDSLLRNRSIIQSLISLACTVVDTSKNTGTEEALRQFFTAFMAERAKQVELGPDATDHDYVDFQKSVNSNVRAGARIRHHVLLRKLFEMAPEFAGVFSSATIQSAGFDKDIEQCCDLIDSRIVAINADYKAQTGTDLFKITSRTLEATKSIRKPVHNIAEYEGLITDLYVLFHEGPGDRLVEKPQSFGDVVVLRTAAQHDTDHGKAGEARRKARNAGTTFERYSGSASPSTLDPAAFQVVQVRILRALAEDLEKLQAGRVAEAALDR